MVKCSLDIEIPNVKAFCYEKQTKIYPSAQSHQQVLYVCVSNGGAQTPLWCLEAAHTHMVVQKNAANAKRPQ